MQFHNRTADVWVPTGAPLEKVLARATHIGIGAHQDDLEIMAFHGIAECYRKRGKSFVGIVCTNGAGSPRVGKYARLTDKELCAIRKSEQRDAARIGKYGAVIQLDYPSSAAKGKTSKNLLADLVNILRHCGPEFLYTHNLADRHDTHLGVVLAVIEAVRTIPKQNRPKHFWGGEVWRDLEWLPSSDRVELDVTGHDDLAGHLIRVFDSQVAGGKRYDIATLGRRQAHATYSQALSIDAAKQVMIMMNLNPLLKKPGLSPNRFLESLANRFRAELLKPPLAGRSSRT